MDMRVEGKVCRQAEWGRYHTVLNLLLNQNEIVPFIEIHKRCIKNSEEAKHQTMAPCLLQLHGHARLVSDGRVELSAGCQAEVCS